MVVPVLREFLEQNKDVEIVMVSRTNFKTLFEELDRVKFHGVQLENYKGALGLWKLHQELYKHYHPDFVADLHGVIRSRFLNLYFKIRGIKIAKIDKGREEKKQLVNVWNIDKKQLKHSTERYADVFRQIGYSLHLSHRLKPNSAIEKQGIGFAPFAQHKGKVMPIEKSLALAKSLAKKYPVYLFGGGKQEVELLNQWEKEDDNLISCAGKLSLKEELEKIASLKLMISMDSANMHLASLMGTRVISIWGATHPYAGFLGYGQRISDAIAVDDLTCRPCSIFGQKECFRGDWACLEELQIQPVIKKVEELMLEL
ncbi:glycosyltransferase family 9 protein [Elizabethkingia sp. JS20170427COW]|uniref:glycosyltransferase family 9 protein n=1 Tax=Elizabethkingia sp. JS20170427COW TaxID=2583851 RepID=UPI0011109D64|nr:glycosyltransferase family 9 protein [Elizabethkingia sp. JS20170427COW]QCX54462.1 glycosyltransferase family 9 protein [Elizabethkingia sp. JS20170427COW]